MSKPDGGLAFGRSESHCSDCCDGGAIQKDGMSLRDYIAIAAMQGMLAGDPKYDVKDVASDAYSHADAMLEARRG